MSNFWHGKRVLVTGGAGFIGSHLVDALSAQGDQVRVLDNFSTGQRANLDSSPSVEIIEGDIRDRGVVNRAMAGIDFVLHQAAVVSVPQSMLEPLTTQAVNVSGTLNVLEAARQAGVQRVVCASSCAVYGDNPDLPLTESAALNPLSPYAVSKLIDEIYSQMYSQLYGLPTVCLRYFNVYGPRQDPSSEYAGVIAKFIDRMIDGQPPTIYGDGLQTRDFVFVGDIVRANLLALKRTEAAGQVFNITSDREVSLLELIDTCNQLLGTAWTPRFESMRPGDIRHSAGAGDKAARLLEFRPEVTLQSGLAKLIASRSRPMVKGEQSV
jgi:UDP-N-acetylglucosamine/UDP-N-acetyl-alpha-D-glucosaminouronate 4-epimerase